MDLIQYINGNESDQICPVSFSIQKDLFLVCYEYIFKLKERA